MSANGNNKALNQVCREGLMSAGGPGTYVFLGPTGCGKNFLLEHQLRALFAAKQHSITNALYFSSTGQFNESYDFLKNVLPPTKVKLIKKYSHLLKMLEDRTQRITQAAETLPTKWKAWREQTQKLVIMDDFAGSINLSSPTNPLLTKISTMRHLGVWLILLIQYKACIGPGMYINSKLVFTFDTSRKSFETLRDASGCNVDAEKNAIMDWPTKQEHNFVIWFFTWENKHIAKPRKPLLGEACEPGIPISLLTLE